MFIPRKIKFKSTIRQTFYSANSQVALWLNDMGELSKKSIIKVLFVTTKLFRVKKGKQKLMSVTVDQSLKLFSFGNDFRKL